VSQSASNATAVASGDNAQRFVNRCRNPRCPFAVHDDPEVSTTHCCQRCETQEGTRYNKNVHGKKCMGITVPPRLLTQTWEPPTWICNAYWVRLLYPFLQYREII
jgi:hypothetical protein